MTKSIVFLFCLCLIMSKNLLLKKLWYEPDSDCAFAGVDRLYHKAHKTDVSITKSYVAEWLAKQTLYSQTKRVVRKFARRRIIATLDSCWSCDLMDVSVLKTYNSHFTFVLVCVDQFSRYLWCQPLKFKRPQNVEEAFRNIFETSNRFPDSVNVDNGVEFKNELIQKFFRTRNIHMYFSNDPNIKSSQSERTIRTLKALIYRFCMSKKSWRFIDSLQSLVKGLNSRKMKILSGLSPSEVNPSNQSELYHKMYAKRGKILSKSPNYKVGDFVRIQINKSPFTRGHDFTFSKDIYHVVHLLDTHPVTYRIADVDNNILNRTFYEQELTKIPNPTEQDEEVLPKPPKKQRII